MVHRIVLCTKQKLLLAEAKRNIIFFDLVQNWASATIRPRVQGREPLPWGYRGTGSSPKLHEVQAFYV